MKLRHLLILASSVTLTTPLQSAEQNPEPGPEAGPTNSAPTLTKTKFGGPGWSPPLSKRNCYSSPALKFTPQLQVWTEEKETPAEYLDEIAAHPSSEGLATFNELIENEGRLNFDPGQTCLSGKTVYRAIMEKLKNSSQAQQYLSALKNNQHKTISTTSLLIFAIENQMIEDVAFLLKHGANPLGRQKNTDKTPLTLSKEQIIKLGNNPIQIVKALKIASLLGNYLVHKTGPQTPMRKSTMPENAFDPRNLLNPLKKSPTCEQVPQCSS
ncbi:MAG: hypothetical protein H6679_03350 [Epsilonproteobacteria bacterium]|nr:hypothetical protein [Campylobacterota bacterium]